MKLTDSFYMTAFLTVLTFILLAVSVPSYAAEPPADYQTYADDYSPDVMDSGTPPPVEFPTEPPVEPSDPDVTPGEAVIQIRDMLAFLVYGIIPLVIACVIIYIFLRWIYGLLTGCV